MLRDIFKRHDDMRCTQHRAAGSLFLCSPDDIYFNKADSGGDGEMLADAFTFAMAFTPRDAFTPRMLPSHARAPRLPAL